MTKRRERNMAQKSKMRTYIKQTLKAITESNIELAKKSYGTLAQYLDNLAGKKIIPMNKAARLKSRINAKLKSMKA